MKGLNKRKINKKKLLITFLILFTIGIIIYFLYINLSKELVPVKKEKMNLTFNDRINQLANFKYKDYLNVGWLQVQGTNIDYPILNNINVDEENNNVNYGWRSIQYESGENREVLLGHNIINVSSTPIRDMSILNNFEGLMAFTYDDFAEENLYISYTKGNSVELYKIYAVSFNDYNSDNSESFSDSNDIKKYIKKVRKNSIYDYDVEVDETDYLITIKTCTRYFGLFEKQELWVDARKVRPDEEILKYTVKKNINYNMLANGSSNENS